MVSLRTKQLIVDPPTGWKYGFPKPIPYRIIHSKKLLRVWFVSQGYPKKDIELALKYSRYWEA